MGHARFWAAVAALVCSLILAEASPAVASVNPLGVHSMLQLNSPHAFMRSMFAEAADLHASALRLDVAPALVFSDPSQPPDFSGLDEIVALAKQYRLRVIGDLFTVPWWIASCAGPTATAQMSRCGTDDLADYSSMIAQIVARADPAIRDWEIWNEPDNPAYFTGTTQQYAQMLRVVHDAIKQIDPEADVLLGGISSTAGRTWLAQVFAAPAADAVHAFDTANIHERNGLDALGGDVESWKRWLAGYGFTGPLWVTEHGYPSDARFQYDPAYRDGAVSQAAYLTASIPTLIDAGAAEVFVTERDNLTGQYAFEGLLGGDVLDPPVADPQPIEKPAYAAVRALGKCYASLGRDCPATLPAASPAAVVMPPTRLRTSREAAVSLTDPGIEPLQLGTTVLAASTPDPFAIERDGCSGQILEPAHTCTVYVRFTSLTGGLAIATLQVPSDNGTLNVAVSGLVPSVSSLTSPQLLSPAFRPTGGVGHTEWLVLNLRNPLSAPVHVSGATLSGPNRRLFRVHPDDCADVTLAPQGRCLVYLLFMPRHRGVARAELTLRGDGSPLRVPLRQGRPGQPRFQPKYTSTRLTLSPSKVRTSVLQNRVPSSRVHS